MDDGEKGCIVAFLVVPLLIGAFFFGRWWEKDSLQTMAVHQGAADFAVEPVEAVK